MSDQYDSNKAKKTQKWVLVGGTVGIIVGFATILNFTGNKEEPQPQAGKPKQELTINANATDNISDTEILSEQTQQDITNNAQQIDDLRSQLKALKEVESAHVNDIMVQMSTNFAKLNSTIEDIKKAPPPSLSGNDGLPPANGRNVGLPNIESEIVVEEPKINTVTIGNGSNESSDTSKSISNNQQSAQSNKNKDTFLSIAFAKAKLITALDAPCGGTAQDNPFPILLNITDNAQLANNMRTKIKSCFLLASAYGDVASERAYARLERMSCIAKDGKVIEVKVEGYLAGEDGKAGIKGTLVSKAGSKVALALLAGTVGGLGQAFASMATTMQNTPIGPTQIVTPSQSLGYAGATGVSQGFNQLAQYYINMAEKTFPVIQINDQRNVTAVFTRGVELPGDTAGLFSSSNKSLPISVN